MYSILLACFQYVGLFSGYSSVFFPTASMIYKDLLGAILLRIYKVPTSEIFLLHPSSVQTFDNFPMHHHHHH